MRTLELAKCKSVSARSGLRAYPRPTCSASGHDERVVTLYRARGGSFEERSLNNTKLLMSDIPYVWAELSVTTLV